MFEDLSGCLSAIRRKNYTISEPNFLDQSYGNKIYLYTHSRVAFSIYERSHSSEYKIGRRRAIKTGLALRLGKRRDQDARNSAGPLGYWVDPASHVSIVKYQIASQLFL